eukprot:m.83727 g.83727  ORF g.83727 m.83727 type:complete len:182 (+) comp8700_c0_seq4:78-623(+)
MKMLLVFVGAAVFIIAGVGVFVYLWLKKKLQELQQRAQADANREGRRVEEIISMESFRNEICPICLSDPPNRPVVTNCGHVYCVNHIDLNFSKLNVFPTIEASKQGQLCYAQCVEGMLPSLFFHQGWSTHQSSWKVFEVLLGKKGTIERSWSRLWISPHFFDFYFISFKMAMHSSSSFRPE